MATIGYEEADDISLLLPGVDAPKMHSQQCMG